MGKEIGIVEVPVKWGNLYENTSDVGGFLEHERVEARERHAKLTLNDESMGIKRD